MAEDYGDNVPLAMRSAIGGMAEGTSTGNAEGAATERSARRDVEIRDGIAAIDALLEPMRCTTPGNPAPGIEHCAACCYGTGWELTCEADEGYVAGLLAARNALVELTGKAGLYGRF